MKMARLASLSIVSMMGLLMNCSNGKEGDEPGKPANLDTFYAATTLQLRSTKIPDSVFAMTSLRHLIITGMDCDNGDHQNCWRITEIPASIKNLNRLVSLRLTLNAISTIPIEVTQLASLKILDLTDNGGLTNYDNIAKCLQLQQLYLFGCGLSKLPQNIGDLKKLVQLGLTGNNFDLPERERIKNALPGCRVVF